MCVQDITDTDDYELRIEVDSAEFKDDNELSIEDDGNTEFWKPPIFFNELPNQNEEELFIDDRWEELFIDDRWEELLTNDEQEELLTNDEQEELLTNDAKGKYNFYHFFG